MKNNLSQPQLLQKNSQQNKAPTTLQENRETIQEEKVTETSILSPNEEKEKLEEMTNSMNDLLKPVQTSLKFEFHDKLEEYYVAIVDDSTEEIIREIPPKKMLDLYASIAESLGFIVDHKI
ncbi:flagellar protein FlaG [Halobacillus locisalis]|uniref:Flagellar protein FlaG n=1 Tax=Halobacillus locisalis TaxID=220753 RepID=A0A838CUB4_9BACI|nr:flagellar protein FlaG [Halobacillus locisalis]